MRPQSSQFQLNILFILLTLCWEGRWMGQAHTLSLQHGDFGSSDDQIEKRSVQRRLDFSSLNGDECYDLYSTVCGGVSYSQPLNSIRLDKEPWHDILNRRLEALIQKDSTYDDELAIIKIKQQYQLCMNHEQRDEMGFDLLKFLIQKDSDFPMIMRPVLWNSRDLRILEPQKYDSSLFSIRVRNRKIYIDKYDVSVYGGFLLNMKNVSSISHTLMYKLRLKEAFRRMRLLNEENGNSFEKDLDDVMDFRRDLHRIVQTRGMVHNKTTVGELQRIVSIRRDNWPQLNWESFLRDVFVNATGVQITSSTEVYVEIAYVLAMRDLILQYRPRCVANHIKLHFFETYLSETSRDMMQISRELAIAAHDTIEQHFHKSSSNPCINQPHILRALNYMYLEKWFPKKSRDAASDMIKEIKNSLRDHVKRTKIISDTAFQWAVGRIHFVTVIIGSEKEYGDYKFLDPLYKYEVPNDHLLSVLNARRYFKEYEYSTLTKSTKTIFAGLPILEDEAYIDSERGIVYLPIGYLHRTSLSPTGPKELSYATLGAELSLYLNKIIIRKGFPSGKFSREGLWYGRDVEGFLNKTACIEKQYNLSWGKRQTTQDETFKKNYDEILEQFVSDNAAFQILYDAFTHAFRKDEIATGEGSSTYYYKDQKFITYWANRYCVDDSEEEKNLAAMRVNNVLRNSEAFHWIFDCNNRTFMNPPDKCTFWG